jgi:hypothetical protein
MRAVGEEHLAARCATIQARSAGAGPVASAPTVWRTLDEITPGRAKKLAAARARVRRHVWEQIPGGVPASKVAGRDLGEVVVLDVDATVVVAHSEKEQASPTYKRTFGFHPIGVWCDNTGEFLASMLRTGRAGSNTAADHIEVLTQAIAQVPAAHRQRLLIRSDSAGASHDLLDWLTTTGQVRGRRLEYSVGFAITDPLRRAIALVPKDVWAPALDADGGLRPGGDVADLTDLLPPSLLARWPEGMRVIVRRERPHPGAQLSLFEEADGWRYQAFVTNTPSGQLAFLEARHRAHARVEDRIRHAKDSGLGRFPSRHFAINTAWLLLVAVAADLVAWTRLLALTGEAKTLASWNPKRCGTGSCTCPPGSPTAVAADGYACPPPGPGQPRSSPSSPTSPRFPNPSDQPVRPRHHHPETRSPAAPAGTPSCPDTTSGPERRSRARGHHRPNLMKDRG